MARKPVEMVQVNLRIRESLRRKLERAANEHHTSLNNEMRLRLENSFEDTGAKQSFHSLAADMKLNWGRWSGRLLLLSLEDDVAEALAQSKDPEVAKAARVFLLTKEATERRLKQLTEEASS